MELESYETGTLLYVGVKEGEAVIVDGILAIIGEKGTDYTPLLSSGKPVAASEVKAEAKLVTSNAVAVEAPKLENITLENNGRVKASPLAKKIAKDKGISIAQLVGSGENGRIIKKDVETYQPNLATNNAPAKKRKCYPSCITKYSRTRKF